MLKKAELLDAVRQRYPAVGERIDDELLSAMTVVAAAQPDAAAQQMVGFGGRERQIVEGDETLLDISFLGLGVERAKSVCRITATFAGGAYHGSGFRIDDNTLLTNHHVLFDWDDGDRPAASAFAWFDYELDVNGRGKGQVEIICDVTTLRGDKDHDWAIVDMSAPIPDAYPALPLVAPATPVAVDDRVYIIQHPNGTRKKIGMHHNLVRHVDDDVLQYWTDTETGSSGSPVFNRSWELVGLHHFWVTTVGDEHAFANQGRRIERIIEGVANLP